MLGEPNANGGDHNEAEKIDGCFLVAGSDAPKMLQPAEEILYEMPLFVEMKINVPTRGAAGIVRNDRGHPFGFDGSDDGVGVVAFVRDEVAPFGRFDELRSFADVRTVAGSEMEMDGVAQGVDQRVDFGGEASARASNTLILGPPFPPAECWWARM